MLIGKIKAVRRKVDEVGVLAGLRLTLRQIHLEWCDRDERLYYLDLQTYVRPSRLKIDGLAHRSVGHIQELSETDAVALANYGGAPYVAQARRRLAAGWQLFLGQVDGQPAGGAWALTRATGIVSKVTPILATDVAIMDCFTFPEHRGRGLYPYLLAEIASFYRDQGSVRAYITVRCHNEASVRGIESAGFVRGVVYQAIRIGSRDIVYWKSRAE
ncbi:MAG: GNAT family N-acetyltransferase [Gemmatimonadota bacterium]|jgi:GNAT superfamily N-acetyltransferase